MRIKSDLPAALKYQAVVIESAARKAGLDFYEVVFELLDAQDVNGVAAYGGFPVRYPFWRFGMDYERLEKGRQWGLSKIYELVINNDPTYAYLVRSNSLLEQKLVMAHVYGHADFFKHNAWFAPTDRHMLDTMGNHSTRVRRYVDAFGLEKVERFMDICLSLESLIDPYLPLREHTHPPETRTVYTPASERARRALDAISMSPLRSLRPVPVEEHKGTTSRRRHPAEPPTYDVLGFLEEHAPLEAWQQDLIQIVRAEAYYFSPQRMTKIINEGWACFWHSRLLTGGLLDASEILDFADCHSGATAVAPGQVNPYKIGLELFRHAEARGDDIFRLRKVHNDVSLVDEVVDEEFAFRHLLPIAMRSADGGAPDPDEARRNVDWRELKNWLLSRIAWGGQPQIELVGVDEKGDGELVLVHHHDGRDLQLGQAKETLRNLGALWGRPVHLLTVTEKEGRRLVANGEEISLMDSTSALEVCLSEEARLELEKSKGDNAA
ncbi:MAG: stage V sporulation protein R [Planctomycetota bacterium]|jgi:stage V sporulation protein R